MVGPVLFNSTKLADQLGSFYDAKVKSIHEELCSVRHRHRSSPVKKRTPEKKLGTGVQSATKTSIGQVL